MMRTKMGSDAPWAIIACMSRLYVGRDSFICVIYVWYDSFICGRHDSWCVRRCEVTHHELSSPVRVVRMWSDWFICVTWLIHVWDMTHDANEDGSHTPWVILACLSRLYGGRDSLMCGVGHDIFTSGTDSWLVRISDMNRDADENGKWRTMSGHRLNESFVCGAWLIHMCDMTHSYVRHDSWCGRRWEVTHHDSSSPVLSCLYVKRDLLMCVIWLIHMRDMTHSYAWHALCSRRWNHESSSPACHDMTPHICAAWLIHVGHDSWLIQMCDMTSSYVGHGSWCDGNGKWRTVSHHRLYESFVQGTWLIYVRDIT